MLQEVLWVEKYRPDTVADCILPVELKATFQKFVDDGMVPNLILTGTQGVGKTSVAKAMLSQLGCDFIVVNGSLNGNIDTLRNEILNFVSSVSLTGGRKYVIIDEADYLNANSTQPAMRGFMDEFSKNAGFVFTANFPKRIIEPLHSRCSVIDFKISKSEKARLASQFFKRVQDILTAEGVEFDLAVVAEVIKKHFPDWRRVLNELQRYSSRGKIDTGILSAMSDESMLALVAMMKDKNYSGTRKWVSENLDSDQTALFRRFYDSAYEFLTPDSVPVLVMTLAKYQHQAAFAADAEINVMGFLTEVMVEASFL